MRFLHRILALRSQHPDQADSFSPLLASVAGSVGDPDQRENFQRLFLEGDDDPLLLKVALSQLIGTNASCYLPAAEELYRKDPSNRALRGAVAQAIATSAPIDLAATTLARLADGSEYGPFFALAMRDGAGEQIAREYDALLAERANPMARKLLVSAMHAETDAVLLGIAGIDPDPRVGIQAALTVTVRGPLDSTSFESVRALMNERIRDDSASALVAENVLINSTGAVRDAAREWMVEIVRNPKLTDAVRSSAYSRVRRWVEPGTFAGVQIGGRLLN